MAAQELGRRVSVVSGEAADEQQGAGADLGSGGAGVTAGLPASSAAARAAVMALLESRFSRTGTDWPREMVIADVLLVTSELVTNANRHGGGLTLFTAAIDGGALHLCVGDASPAHPVSPPAPAVPAVTPRIGGYGWQMVHRLARTVGVVTHGAGKTISAVVALHIDGEPGSDTP